MSLSWLCSHSEFNEIFPPSHQTLKLTIRFFSFSCKTFLFLHPAEERERKKFFYQEKSWNEYFFLEMCFCCVQMSAAQKKGFKISSTNFSERKFNENKFIRKNLLLTHTWLRLGFGNYRFSHLRFVPTVSFPGTDLRITQFA